MKFKIATLFLIVLPFAAFLAGVSRGRRATIHLGMTIQDVSRAMQSISAKEYICPTPIGDPTIGSPSFSTNWKLPNSTRTIEAVTFGDQVVERLYLDREAVKKLTIHRQGPRIIASDRLNNEEIETAKRNRSQWSFLK